MLWLGMGGLLIQPQKPMVAVYGFIFGKVGLPGKISFRLRLGVALELDSGMISGLIIFPLREAQDWELDLFMTFWKTLYDHLPSRSQEDVKMSWSLSSDSIFLVKSFYLHLLMANRKVESPSLKWDSVWLTPCPTKVSFFFWEALWGRILTINNLIGRGFFFPNICVLCKFNEESVSHLLLHCSSVAKVGGTVWNLMGVD
ncbi:uncharacterized protein LOC119982818 [Tripterygium wilfordii]|uniref:uncharacterized protein LOC119982818 n=1 Tax=Tripterygium wilfordii TaxID=458696 RepID=UPI0018F83C48|nr:uncharacterized protein LOC119982818 [Tripterygium wilfordii]